MNAGARTGAPPEPQPRSAAGPVLYLVGQLTAGGQERQLLYLVRGLAERGLAPHVAVWNYAERDPFAGAIRDLPIQLHPVGTGSRWTKVARLRRIVDEVGPSLIHSYSFYTNFAATLAALGRQTIAIGSIRDELWAQRRASGGAIGLLSSIWPRAKICNSQRVADHLVGRAERLRAGRVLVVRNGMDLGSFPAAPQPPPPGRILGVGRLVRQKRWDLLITAAHRLARQGFEFEILVAGEGPMRAELEAMARRLGLETRVRFIGHSDDVPGLLARSAGLVLASDHEGCPNVVMEAMACGRAVVATDAGEVRYLVQEGVTGFVVPPGDEPKLAERLELVLQNRELRARMGRAGRERAERAFGVGRFVDETLSAYRQAGWAGA